jgi:hypothetical protein
MSVTMTAVVDDEWHNAQLFAVRVTQSHSLS